MLHVDKILDEMVDVETLAVVNISLVEHPLIGGFEGAPLIVKGPWIVRGPWMWVDTMAVELTTAEMVEALLMQEGHTQ